MKNRVIPLVIGVLVTLILSAITFTLLLAHYHGNIPWLPAVVVKSAGPYTVLAAVLVTVIFVVGGGLSGWLTRVRLSLNLA